VGEGDAMSKKKAAQLPMFVQGEELPIFTQSQYGAVVAPFVPVETGKQAVMFRATFQEMARAQQDKKGRK
jgi:hypothetical protein